MTVEDAQIIADALWEALDEKRLLAAANAVHAGEWEMVREQIVRDALSLVKVEEPAKQHFVWKVPKRHRMAGFDYLRTACAAEFDQE